MTVKPVGPHALHPQALPRRPCTNSHLPSIDRHKQQLHNDVQLELPSQAHTLISERQTDRQTGRDAGRQRRAHRQASYGTFV